MIVNDIVVVAFSKDRPMQALAMLDSFYEQCEEACFVDKMVIYKTSSQRQENAYNLISSEYKDTQFIIESEFKKNVLSCLQNKRYILFVVDDCIFTNPFSLLEIGKQLQESENTVGFSLRLGRNTTHCYTINEENQIPDFRMNVRSRNVQRFQWTNVDGDFGYPFDVSSSFYDIELLMPVLLNTKYRNPNEFEWNFYLSKDQYRDSHPYLLSYKTSVAFCNPINKVQTINNNRSGISFDYTSKSLLTKFENGGRIDISKFNNFISNGCHQEVDIDIIYSTSIS
jgi:hypothetical protein